MNRAARPAPKGILAGYALRGRSVGPFNRKDYVMRRLVSAATAGALMLGTVMAGATGATAAPISAAPLGKVPTATVDTSMVEQVRHRRHGRHHRHRGRNLGIALGAAGLVLGLSALASRPSYGDPYYRRPAYGYGGYGAAPWSPAWYDYCSSRYRSFNPRTGYFKGYDGQFHFCR